MAARGDFALTSAMYYNDQPPEMMYYAAKALDALGDSDTANARFDTFIAYANTHMHDDIKIEYFAVSLPDFLIFEADLNKKIKYTASSWLHLAISEKELLQKQWNSPKKD